MGVTIGMVLGSSSFYIMTSIMSEELFLSIGWRIPFILSAFLVLFGLWIRKDLDETPEFRASMESGKIPKVPIVDTWKYHKREVLITSGAKFVETAPFYIFGTFIVGYATKTLGYDFSTVMLVVMISATITSILIPYMGALSDRIGRQKLYLIGAVAMFLFMIPYFLMLQTNSVIMLFLATIIGLSIIWSPITAVLGTMFSEVFSTEVRYTGVTLGYQIGAALAGGTAPMVAEFLMGKFDQSWLPVALYIMVISLISIFSVLQIKHKPQVQESKLVVEEV